MLTGVASEISLGYQLQNAKGKLADQQTVETSRHMTTEVQRVRKWRQHHSLIQLLDAVQAKEQGSAAYAVNLGTKAQLVRKEGIRPRKKERNQNARYAESEDIERTRATILTLCCMLRSKLFLNMASHHEDSFNHRSIQESWTAIALFSTWPLWSHCHTHSICSFNFSSRAYLMVNASVLL